MIRELFTVLLCSVGLTFQQAAPFHFTVESDSPVVFSGTVRAAETPEERLRYSYEVAMSATNRSSQAVLLLVTRVDVERAGSVERSLTSIRDYFFSEDPFYPGSTRSWRRTLAAHAHSPRSIAGSLSLPEARAEVVFVQFSDGSCWGDLSPAQDILRDRRLGLNMLERLAETYRSQGEEEFLAQLMEPSELLVLSLLKGLYAKSNDPRVVYDRVMSMLGQAHRYPDALSPPAQTRYGGVEGVVEGVSEGAAARVYAVSEARPVKSRAQAVTIHSDGTFRFQALPIGRTVLYASQEAEGPLDVLSGFLAVDELSRIIVDISPDVVITDINMRLNPKSSSLHGRVLHSESLVPLESVRITLCRSDKPDLCISTTVRGEFTLRVPASPLSLRLQAEGFQEYAIESVTPGPEASLRHTFLMKPNRVKGRAQEN